ncbi:MAG: hypothetical protein IPN10_16755 [Saprospiraceae bacterium]|nr:hypothetical protein [Saprospiraceae bacterium]
MPAKKCFNCPKSKNPLGIEVGYSMQDIGNYNMEIVQFGFKVEPLFKYGFGFNTGINLQGYSRNLFENQLFNNGFEAYAVNIPVHLEYRFNFSKWFNIFAFGGAGINFYTESSFSEFTYPVSLDYGAGLRINRIQFTLGKKFTFR